jgi:hypothetical protein
MFIIQKIFVKLDGSSIAEDAKAINDLGYIIRNEKEKFSGFVTANGTVDGSSYTLNMLWESKDEWKKYINHITPTEFYGRWYESLNDLLNSKGITQDTVYLNQ